jgi:hypothetical protein
MPPSGRPVFAVVYVTTGGPGGTFSTTGVGSDVGVAVAGVTGGVFVAVTDGFESLHPATKARHVTL